MFAGLSARPSIHPDRVIAFARLPSGGPRLARTGHDRSPRADLPQRSIREQERATRWASEVQRGGDDRRRPLQARGCTSREVARSVERRPDEISRAGREASGVDICCRGFALIAACL